jgi:hypothetical protein
MKKSSAFIPITCAFLIACQPSRQSNVSLDVSPNPTPVLSPSVNTSALASPDKPWRDPSVACEYLSSVGLRTKPYQDYDGQSWCMASVFYAESAPVPNEISYTASGNQSRVQQLELSAEIYNYVPAEDYRTIEEASEMAQQLLRVALGTKFPKEPIRAFRKGGSGRWALSNGMIEVIRDEHRPGRGFTITLRIK